MTVAKIKRERSEPDGSEAGDGEDERMRVSEERAAQRGAGAFVCEARGLQ